MIDQSTVFYKTEKGLEELSTRRYKVKQSSRFLLIMINGQNSVADIMKNCRGHFNSEEALLELYKDDYIGVLSGGLILDPDTASESVVKSELIRIAEHLLPRNSKRVVSHFYRAPNSYNDLKGAIDASTNLLKDELTQDKSEQFKRVLSQVLKRHYSYSGEPR